MRGNKNKNKKFTLLLLFVYVREKFDLLLLDRRCSNENNFSDTVRILVLVND